MQQALKYRRCPQSHPPQSPDLMTMVCVTPSCPSIRFICKTCENTRHRLCEKRELTLFLQQLSDKTHESSTKPFYDAYVRSIKINQSTLTNTIEKLRQQSNQLFDWMLKEGNSRFERLLSRFQQGFNKLSGEKQKQRGFAYNEVPKEKVQLEVHNEVNWYLRNKKLEQDLLYQMEQEKAAEDANTKGLCGVLELLLLEFKQKLKSFSIANYNVSTTTVRAVSNYATSNSRVLQPATYIPAQNVGTKPLTALSGTQPQSMNLVQTPAPIQPPNMQFGSSASQQVIRHNHWHGGAPYSIPQQRR